jgi:hypothetical protein
MAYSQEEKENIFEYVFKEIEKGRALRNVLKDENTPHADTFYEWLEKDSFKSERYARATQIRADVIFDDMLIIADQNENDTYTNEDGKVLINNDVINRAKLRIDTRKWVLSKLNPKKYGDKIQQEHSGEIKTTIISLGNGIDPNEATD